MSFGIKQKKSKILVVDDTEGERKLTEILCRSLGHDVVIAKNGFEGVEMARQEMPDIILMDVMMPEMNGFEATELIKSNNVTKHIPVIILTSLNQKEDRIKGLMLGADDYVTKPFSMEELYLRIRNLLKRAGHETQLTQFELGNFTFDRIARTLTNQDYVAQLSEA